MNQNVLIPTIQRVIIEYGHKIIYLEGEEAERWQTSREQQAIIARLKEGYKTPPLNWKEIPKNTPDNAFDVLKQLQEKEQQAIEQNNDNN